MTITYKRRTATIPDRWEQLTTDQFLHLAADLMRLAAGQVSVGELRLRLLCHVMGWRPHRMKDPDTLANAIALSERITFPLRITYPQEADQYILPLPRQQREQVRRIDPFRLRLPVAEKLRQMDYRYTIDLMFCKQFLPVLKTRRHEYPGYVISTAYDTLTLSLTAMQYIEAMMIAREGMNGMDGANGANGANGHGVNGHGVNGHGVNGLNGSNGQASPSSPSSPLTPSSSSPLTPSSSSPSPSSHLPLLAAILYTPQPYSSEAAHAIADDLATLPPETLQAVAWNFQALNNFIFTLTPFSLLAQVKERRSPPIATDAADALYDLSADGLGNSTEVEQMNIITYLRILRKKTIDTVRLMRSHQIGTPQISAHTGLPLNTINQIIGMP